MLPIVYFIAQKSLIPHYGIQAFLIFGLNYKISYSIVEEKQYIEKITNSLIYEDRKIEKFFKQIEIVLRNYIKKKTI